MQSSANALTHATTDRAYAGEADLPAMVDLINACEAVDKLERSVSLDELRRAMGHPTFEPALNVRLWHAADGRLVGLGRLEPEAPDAVQDAYFSLHVHPDARGNGLEDVILAWGAARLRELGQERDLPVVLHTSARVGHAERIALLERHGFTVARYFMTVERPLSEPLPEPAFPPGYSARPLRGLEEAAAWVALFNETFIDHFNHHDETVEQFTFWYSAPEAQPDLCLVAVANDGTLAAFCWGFVRHHQNARSGRNEGWVGSLGTRRGHRNQGVGRALLLTGLARLGATGVDAVRLSVDADSPTGATRLYDAVGFRPVHTDIVYGKSLAP